VLGPLDIAGHPVEGIGDAAQHLVPRLWICRNFGRCNFTSVLHGKSKANQ
jgi:hypothetical protein